MAKTRPKRKAAAKTHESAGVKKKAAPKKTAHHATGKRKGGRPRKHPNGTSKASHDATAPRLTSANTTAPPDFVVHGDIAAAEHTLTCYRGEGMCLLAMNWKQGTPPDNFVGFAIEFCPPEGKQFFTLNNRLAFPGAKGQISVNTLSSRLSPFQKFRWIHFPSDVSTPGHLTYRVTPVFMDEKGVLSYGHYQEAAIELEAETYPGEMNIAFTRGFISSQAFVDKFGTNGGVGTILPTSANAGLDFQSKDPQEETALAWMGFEARSIILNTLDAAVADTSAQVRVAAYDFNDPEIVSRLEKLGNRLKIIIDDSGSHKPPISSETRAAGILTKSAGADNVQRQHMGDLQHNKTILVNGDKTKIAIGGSTNLSWRGIYVQNNNAVVLQGENAVQAFSDAFDNLWASPDNVSGFDNTASADWIPLNFPDFNASVTFSPHSKSNAKLAEIGDAISATKSSLFYSLAFLYETKGVIRNAIEEVTDNTKNNIFVYGISDKQVGGLNLQQPNGNPPTSFPAALMQDVPPPFKEEATGGNGTRLHHKFVVIDFNTPDACVYTGSYNFSVAADMKNAENLFMIKDERVATSYAVEAVAMFDHYSFRDEDQKAKDASPLELKTPPGQGEKAWWDEYWSDHMKTRDRELFGQ
jgi:hypothetical protein